MKKKKDSLNINNMNGENIKIILGNSVTSEGMDFKNIRENTCFRPMVSFIQNRTDYW